MQEDSLQRFINVGIVILLALLLLNLFITFELRTGIERKLTEVEESASPAELELIIIEADCVGCSGTDEFVAYLKDLDNINIISELSLKSSSQEAEILINKHNIEKLPSVILKGEINKASVEGLKEEADALIFEVVVPPYINAKTGEVIGMVSAFIITAENCEMCFDFSVDIQNLKQANVVFSEIKELDINSVEAREIITKYGIKQVPFLLLSTDIDVYSVSQSLQQAGIQSNQGYYFLKSPAPYVEADTGKVRGLVSLTMISDDSCIDCYDVTDFRQILVNLGLFVNEEKILDINSSEGKELVELYNISKVPTVILTGDLAVYDNFNILWQQLGTVEDDKAYVFRDLNAMEEGTIYKDLSANETITVGGN